MGLLASLTRIWPTAPRVVKEHDGVRWDNAMSPADSRAVTGYGTYPTPWGRETPAQSAWPNPPEGPEWQTHPSDAYWRPAGYGQAPWEQIGRWGAVLLSQFPARWEGLQRNNGREGNNPGWVVAYGSAGVPYWEVTVTKGNVAGAQRQAGKPSNPAGVGPITGRFMRESVVNAQIQQSGAQAMSWAQALRTWGSGS